MYTARHFGIDKNDGLVKTFMSNDWMHGIFVNAHSDDKIKVLASLIIGSEITVSTGAVMYFQATNVSIPLSTKARPFQLVVNCERIYEI